MTFSLSKNVYILVAQWKTLTDKGLSGSFFAVFSFTLFAECVRSYNLYRKSVKGHMKFRYNERKRLRVLALESVLHLVQIVNTYLLMVVAMTYNVWLFLAVLLGSGVGYFLCVPLLNRFIVRNDVDLELDEPVASI